MGIKFKRPGKTILLLMVALGGFYYVLRNISISELIGSLEKIRSVYFLPAVVLLLLSYWARAYRWRALLLPFKKVPVTEVYFVMMAGFLGNVLPFRAGELLRSYILKRKQNIALSGAFATILMKWFFDVLIMLILFSWVFKFYAESFNFNFPDSDVSTQALANHFGQFCLTLTVGLVLFIYSFLEHKKKILAMIHWFSRHLSQKWHNRVKSLFDNLNLGFSSIKNTWVLFQVIFYSALEWLLTIFSFYPMFSAYNLSATSESLVILTVMIVVFTMLFPTPGFLGSFNAGVYVALHHIMGKSEVIAANFGLTAWTLNFLVILFSGFYFIVKEQLSLRTLWKED